MMKRLTNPDVIRYNNLSSEINALYHELSVKLGLSDSVQNILYVVFETDGKCQQSDIFRETGISRQTINSALRKLEAEQIVYLEPGTGRNTVVCLTEKGKAFCGEKIAPIFALENHIFDGWTSEERKTYLELTQRYLATFREEICNLL